MLKQETFWRLFLVEIQSSRIMEDFNTKERQSIEIAEFLKWEKNYYLKHRYCSPSDRIYRVAKKMNENWSTLMTAFTDMLNLLNSENDRFVCDRFEMSSNSIHITIWTKCKLGGGLNDHISIFNTTSDTLEEMKRCSSYKEMIFKTLSDVVKILTQV